MCQRRRFCRTGRRRRHATSVRSRARRGGPHILRRTDRECFRLSGQTSAAGGVRFRRIASRRAEADLHRMADPTLTVYHDGSCPLCRMEIDHYRCSPGAEHIAFVDVSGPGEDPGPDLPREAAIGRFHVRLPTGELRSGAAAFREVWTVLPRWRPAARIARIPGILPALEFGYRAFLPLRPRLAKLVRRFAPGRTVPRDG